MLSINPSATQQRLSNDLVQINTNLRYELDHSIELCTLLNNENQVLKQSYEQLKNELNDAKTQLNDAKQVAETTLQVKQNIEQECESLYIQWKQQVETLTAQYTQYQANSVSKNELQIQSVILSEKYDNVYKIKCDELTQQIHKYHTLYQQCLTQCNTLQNTLNTEKQLYAHELDVQAKQHSIALETLSDKNAKLQQLLQQDTHTDTIRTLERNNNELIVVVAQNKNERERLLEQIDALQTQLNSFNMNNDTDLQRYKQDNVQLKSDNATQQNFIEKLKIELASVQHDNSELNDKNLHLHAESQLLNNKLLQLQQLHHNELHTHSTTIKKLESDIVELKQANIDDKQALNDKFEAERKHWQQTESELRSNIEKLNDRIKQLDSAATAVEQQHKTELTQLRQQLLTCETTIATLNNTIDKLKAEKADSERNSKSTLQRSDSVQSELTAKQSEIKQLSDKHAAELRKLNEVIESHKSERTVLLQRIKNFEDDASLHGADTVVPSNTVELEKLRADKVKYKKLCVTLQKKLETVLQDFSLFQTQHSNCSVTE